MPDGFPMRRLIVVWNVQITNQSCVLCFSPLLSSIIGTLNKSFVITSYCTTVRDSVYYSFIGLKL